MFLCVPVEFWYLRELTKVQRCKNSICEAHFNRQRVPFFTVLVALLILSSGVQMFLLSSKLMGTRFQIALDCWPNWLIYSSPWSCSHW